MRASYVSILAVLLLSAAAISAPPADPSRPRMPMPEPLPLIEASGGKHDLFMMGKPGGVASWGTHTVDGVGSCTAIGESLAKPMRAVGGAFTFVPNEMVAFQDVAPAPKPKGDMSFELADGTKVRLVDPAKLQVIGGKKFSIAAGGAKEALKDVKPAPSSFDYAKTKDGKAISFPMLGNNRWGDCFYVAPAHLTQSVYGVRTGKQLDFDEAKLVARYKVLSGGDNGLSSDDIMPEWLNGIVGPNGPHKILDWATIDPSDTASIKTACYYMGGLVTTHSMRTTWVGKQDAVWDANGRIDPWAGHAIHCCGVNAAGNYVMTTWGLTVQMTPAGMANSRAQVIVPVAYDWFDSRGYTPNGTHYTEVAKVWEIGTGRKLPVGIFPEPGPAPEPEPTPKPPVPPTPSTGSVVVDPATKTVTVPPGWTVNGGSTPTPTPPGVTSPAVERVKSMAAKRQARKDGAGLLVSTSELAAARKKIDAAVSDAEVEKMLAEQGAFKDGKVGGPLTDFLEWLSTHQAEIEKLIELILKLVALFA